MILTLLIMLLPTAILAEGGRKSARLGHVFGGLGLLYSPASLRVGGATWEVGLLNSRSFGIATLNNFSANSYASLGVVVMTANNPGIFAGVGTEFWNWRLINFRLEANAAVSQRNQNHAEILFGISLNI